MPQSDTHTTHREVELLETLRGFGGSARTANLAETLNVSEETIRRTVKALAKSGLVQRVHGGVYLSNAEALSPVGSRIETRASEKARIGAAVAALIPNGSSVFLDVGSTTSFVAQSLKDHTNLTIITNSLHIAQTMLPYHGCRIFLAGGELAQSENGAFGADTIAFIKRFNIDTAIVSIDGFDTHSGFLLTAAAEADLANAVIKHAVRTIIASDSNKFGQSAPIVACDPTDVDIILSDRSIGAPFRAALERWDIEFIPVSDTSKQ